ncbi:hypothetical protein CRENBAI_001729 [Crenichthys baileyi]|uniref:Uncharacterized protein n=1 Tax=Crenichthys baileyi TaxID=28760 RepID=A0AAV9SCM4_9TELE
MLSNAAASSTSHSCYSPSAPRVAMETSATRAAADIPPVKGERRAGSAEPICSSGGTTDGWAYKAKMWRVEEICSDLRSVLQLDNSGGLGRGAFTLPPSSFSYFFFFSFFFFFFPSFFSFFFLRSLSADRAAQHRAVILLTVI